MLAEKLLDFLGEKFAHLRDKDGTKNLLHEFRRRFCLLKNELGHRNDVVMLAGILEPL